MNGRCVADGWQDTWMVPLNTRDGGEGFVAHRFIEQTLF